jgi:type II secretory pathway pseudopilin PulG
MRRSAQGFTLVELAVVFTIVALLVASLLYTLSAQTEQRAQDDTRRRLEQARELVLSFAVVKGRLPCPARSANTTAPVTTAGDEVQNASQQCNGDSVDDYYGGSNAGVTLGLLPARTIGFTQVDSSGFAVDAWGNRIRYAVAKTVLANSCTVTTPSAPYFVSSTNLKSNGVACQPGDLIICKSATGISGTSCGGASNQVNAQNLVVAIIFSTGKNGAISPSGAGVDEQANVKSTSLSPQINPVFVFHTRTDNTFANGEFDDQFTWITAGELYGRLIAAGVLP